jgi:hypothetical protein
LTPAPREATTARLSGPFEQQQSPLAMSEKRDLSDRTSLLADDVVKLLGLVTRI